MPSSVQPCERAAWGVAQLGVGGQVADQGHALGLGHGDPQRALAATATLQHEMQTDGALARAALAFDQVDVTLRQAAAEHFVQPLHASPQAIDRCFAHGHSKVSCAASPLVEVSQTGRSSRSASDSPIKLVRRS